MHHIIQLPFFSSYESYTVYTYGRSVLLFEKETLTPPPTSEWIMLPQIPNYTSQETIGTASWLCIGLFDSRTQTFKTYLLSLPNTKAVSKEVYDNGIVLAHNAGFFMKITICQEDNFVWTSIPAHRELQINRSGSTILLRYHNDTIQLCDARTGAAVFDSLHSDKYLVGDSDDGTKIALCDLNSDVTSVFDMALGGKVIVVLDGRVGRVLLFGEKITYELNKCLIIQSLETGDILFRHGIPEHWGPYHIDATPDGTRVITYNSRTCMVWDVGDL
ncbi:uncharacterized protein EV420DRAFT_1650768 [Desarmillaria tabescens]|uniref:Uncharacterized protein n=1 Tax=Armillaria tabescens TaxID=1929756 RepID=A0AA39JBI4_ARMTA|nr:uncharacterized protein EV420DRAFT_1650768 [Desarmillaria tabescens]KAK0439720.1 hypothetical protein EV420DRAFT_1650768 [Desarmillaria tabescens]